MNYPFSTCIIALAVELGAPVLLDEKEARNVAKEKGLIVVGTVGLIERAAQLNLLDLGQTLGALQQTNARISKTLLDEPLQRHAQRIANRSANRAPPLPEK